MKDRVASLLKKDIKADVLSQSSSKKNKDENVIYFVESGPNPWMILDLHSDASSSVYL